MITVVYNSVINKYSIVKIMTLGRNGFSVRVRYVYWIDVITKTLLMSKNAMFIQI